ncbi:MAG: class I SAM-dependent methyltransferase [Roseiarcus sp.]|jgi:SAM-dependent methyltransferase
MSESMADPAAMWDRRYAGDGFAYGETANAYLSGQRARLRAGMRALVPGDGEGRNGVWLAEQGLIVDTLDLSRHGVAKARRLAQARGVALNAVQTDALAWEWPGEAYDVVALIFLHLVADERRALHARVVGALKPGGLVILEAFRPEQLARQAAGARGGPRVRELLYALDDLEADFAALNTIELGEADADFDEGTLHVGLSAVVRATMRRP